MSEDALLSGDDVESALSIAYVQAIAAQAGYTCGEPPGPDRDSIDLQIAAGGTMRPKLDLQLKASINLVRQETEFRFRLKLKNYNDLRVETQTPRILVVLDLPKDQNKWLSVSIDELIIRRASLLDMFRWIAGVAKQELGHYLNTSSKHIRCRSSQKAYGEITARISNMKAHIVDADALSAVSPQALRAYAESEHWKPLERYGKHSHVFIKDEHNDEAIIPGTSAIGDYANVVAELIELFARTENRDELQVYRDLVTADRDVVRIRTPDADDDGSVKIEAGVDLVVHARDLLLSAACSAWSPRQTYRAGKVRQADDYMSRVRLGQTEQGSFVVTLLAPVPPAIRTQGTLWPIEDDEPFERQVTKRLSTGLDAAAAAIEKLNLCENFSVFEDAVSQGVSANLCEATGKLSENERGVEVSITWAKTRPTLLPRWSRMFTRSEGEMLKAVARTFYEKQPRPDEQVEGFVVDLHREESSDEGRVRLRAIVDGKPVSVQTELEPEKYKIAIQAHDEKRPLSLVGNLERVGRRWKLVSPSSVQIIPDEPEDSIAEER